MVDLLRRVEVFQTRSSNTASKMQSTKVDTTTTNGCIETKTGLQWLHSIGHEWLLPAYADRSVTEIEMLYGSLFYPELAKNSFFYLRLDWTITVNYNVIDIICRDPKYLDVIQARDSIAKARDYQPQTELEKRRVRYGVNWDYVV